MHEPRPKNRRNQREHQRKQEAKHRKVLMGATAEERTAAKNKRTNDIIVRNGARAIKRAIKKAGRERKYADYLKGMVKVGQMRVEYLRALVRHNLEANEAARIRRKQDKRARYLAAA